MVNLVWALKNTLHAISRFNSLTQLRSNMLTEWKKLSDMEAARAASGLTTEATQVFIDKPLLRSWVFENQLDKDSEGFVLEFGVRGGGSILQIAAAGHNVYGFDSFEGLRDPWSKPGKGIGSMNQSGEIPHAIGENSSITIVRGWVEDTLPGFLESHPGPVKLAHLDLDVGPPTRFVLNAISERLGPGSLLVFDDFFGHIGWQNHSFKAFQESLNAEDFLCTWISPMAVVFKKR